MSKITVASCLESAFLWACAFLFSTSHPSAQAAQRTWTGLGSDALWSTADNWDSGVPTSSDTAFFSGNGNARTAVTLGSGAAAAALNFASDAAAYTVGLPSETLTLSANATLTLSAGATNNQTVGATLLVGGNFFVYNNEPSKTLTLNYTNSVSHNIYVYGTGPVTFDTLHRPAGTESNDTNYIRLDLRTPAPVTCTGPLTIGQLWKDSSFSPSELILAPHTTNIFCRNDWEFALSGCTISGGEGTVLRLLHAQANTQAAIALQTVNPVTISVRLECPTGLATLNKGGGGWTLGTLVLDYPDNLIDNAVTIDRGNCFQVPFLAPNGTPNPLGACTNVNFTNPLYNGIYARLRVTGSAASSSDKAFTVDKDRAVIENTGTGTLTLTGPFTGAGTFGFDALGDITLSGVRSGTGGLVKSGTATLTLTAANTYTGTTAIEGGTLALPAGASLGSGTLTLAGGTLALNPTAADGYSVSIPAVTLTAASALTVPAAASASSVTLASLALNGYTLVINAPSAGTAANRIFITGLADGPVSGVVLNGGPATYSSSTGLAPRTLTPVAVTDDTLPDSAGSAATADTAPAGNFSVAASLTTLGQFAYTAASPATLDLGGGILALDYLSSEAPLSVVNGTLTASGAIANIDYPGLRTVSIVPLTSDAATGLSTAKTYTHLIDFGNQGVASTIINGVAFTLGAATGTGSNYSGFPNGNTYSGYNSWTNDLPPETCSGLRALLYDMNYNGNFTAQLTGLTPGAVYEITLFFRAWDAPPSTQERRSIYQFYSVSSSYPDTSVIYASQPNSANAIVYRYMAPASGILKFAVTAVAISGNVASGCFGFSNEQLAAAAGTPPSTGSLALSGPLTISAALADNGSPTALTAAGTDPLTLSGPVSLTGIARFDVPLTLAPGASVTQAFNGPVSGNAAFTVNGNGRVILNTANPGLSSPVVVSTGILEIAHSHSLGASASPHVTVLSGGALAIGQTVNNAIVLTNAITIAGNGPDDLGALRFDYDNLQYNALMSVALSDDAAVGGNGPSPLPYNGTRGRFDIRSGTLNFDGHTLSKVGSSSFIISSSRAAGVTPDAAISVQSGVLGLEGSTYLGGSATNTASVAADAVFDFNGLSFPVYWTLSLADGAHLAVRSGATNQNVWAGPVTLAGGQAILDGQTSYAHNTLAGEISGSGGLLKSYGGYTYLCNLHNTFSGAITVTNSLLYAYAPGSVPSAPASLTVSGSGEFVARYVSDGWSLAQIENLASSGAFQSRLAYLGIDTADSDLAYTADWPATGLAKLGPYTLTPTGNWPSPSGIRVHDGTLDLNSFNGGTLNLGAYGVQVGFDNWAASCGNLPLSGNTAIATVDNGYNRSQPAVGSGTLGSSRGILTVSDNAFVRGRLYVGRDGGSAGAIYQTGGVFLNIGGSAADGRIGESGFGYYEISGGALTNKGYTQLSYNSGAYGTLRVKGEGRVVFNSGTVPAQGTGGDNPAAYYGGNLATRSGYGHFFLSGNGTLDTGTAAINLCEWDGVNTYNNGYGFLTLEENAAVSANTVIVANRNSTPLSAVTLKGGTLSTRYIQKGGNNAAGNTAQAAINFDGGSLSIRESGSAVRTGANNTPALLTVHSGGAVIDTPAVIGATLDLPLIAEQIGVNYIEVSSQGSGYIAPPAVLITGGGGTGAVAEAVLSDGKVTGIRVLSPGTGYTSTPSVTLNGGGPLSAATIRTSYIGAPSAIDGGLTKTGLGILTLNAANAYRGPTTVKGGTLMSSAAGSVPSGSDLVLDGGFLNLGGRTITNASVTLSSGGALVNGSVVTAALRKDGSGSADLAAGISLTSLPPSANYGTPGLYEGRLTNISGNSNRADPNPCWTIQLTTRAVNGGYVGSGGTINNCLWPDNTCYVYTGYLWNRTGTNVVWTFGENFDDSVYLLIDGHAVLDNNSASTPTYRNIMLIPGPHAFEVRCGQGGSSVGGNWVQTSAYRLGFGVDFLGRAQNVADNYQPLTDPGDGSLLTVDLPAGYTAATVSSAPNQPDLPTEVVSNVGSLADGYALVYASDIPATGGIINGSVAGTRYFTDNSQSDTNDFDRIAYYVELTSSTYGNQWVWVSFDAVTRDRSLIGYPWHDFTAGSNYCANIFQQKVSNMDVKSNVSTITNYVGSATGNIEFWPNDYGQSDYLGLGASTTTYDFGDSMSSFPLSVPSHGSFQVHNWGDKTTLFAVDNWGKANSTISLGIGNQPSGNPDWTFNYNGTAYTYRRLYVFTRDLVRTPTNSTPTAVVAEGTLRLPSSSVTHPVPADIRAKAGSAADGYDLLYASALPVTCATLVNGTAYSINYSADTVPFDRVAYFLELDSVTNGYQWVWISFDSYTTDRTKLGFPNQTGNLFMWQQKVNNMDVVCNVNGITNYTGCAKGNVEIWPSNYSNATVPASGLGGSGSAYDFDDSGGNTNSQGHGCFQIHNWVDKTTLLAISHCGASGNTLGIGIGNNPVWSNNDPDYTFTYNAAQYTMRNFYVFVRPAVTAMDDALASVDLTVEAGATLDLDGATQTVHTVSGSGTVSNGVLAANVILSPAGDGTVGTLALTDVQFASSVRYHADLGDLLNVTGSLDVSGMIIRINNPEDLDRSQSYTLIHTTGGVTGSATLETALPSGWKLLRRGNDLLLFSESGILIKIR